MNTLVLDNRFDIDSIASTALKAVARFWFVVAVIGQCVFAFAVASFYGLTAWRGDYHGWGKFITHGHVPGDSVGNFAVATHIISAVVVMLAGALQLVPQVRSRFPVFHRWNGRIYLLTTVSLSVAGLYMLWFRGSVGDGWQRAGSSLNAVVIWICAAMALRRALARDFRTHRRWALRLFLVASAAYFFRVAFFLTLLIFHGPVGFDPTTFSGPLLTFLTFAQFAVPLIVLEIYLRAQDAAAAIQRMAAARLLFVLTLGMAAGIFAITMAVWIPDVKAGFDPRTSIAETLTTTIAARGIDDAVAQYHRLKNAEPARYNFGEGELNTLGYQFIRKQKFNEAIRILQLNVEAYPRSSNAYDSLAKAYADAGNSQQAIIDYRIVLRFDPDNGDAAAMLRKLGAR